jgi:hypothetical protein
LYEDASLRSSFYVIARTVHVSSVPLAAFFCRIRVLGAWFWDTGAGVWKPGSLRAWEPGSLGAWEPGSLGAWEPGSLGAWEPGSLGAWKPESGISDLKSVFFDLKAEIWAEI